MTTTSTDPLAALMSARKAEIVGQPTVPDEVIPPVDAQTGEIVPVVAADASPTVQSSPSGQPAAAPAPAEPAPDYSFTPAKVLGAIPFADAYWRMARRVCRTDFVPQGFRGNPEAIVAAFMRGYEMGFPPMQSLDSFNVIQGSVGLKPEAMRALIFDAGHQIILEEEYGDDGSVTAIVAACKRKDWDTFRSYRYGLEDARQAGLLGKDNWKKMPRAMLEARATAGAGRRYFADILAGMSYTPEEIRDFARPEQEVTSSPTVPTPTPDAAAANGSAEAPSATPTAASVESGAPPTASTSTPPSEDQSSPKRPRGRPRKPVTSTSERPTVEASTADSAPSRTPSTSIPTVPSTESPPSTPKESTLSEVLDHGDPGGAKVNAAMITAYREIVAGLPQVQQPLCRAFVQAHFPERSLDQLNEIEIQKACDIACGWPESADTHPLPEDGQQVMV